MLAKVPFCAVIIFALILIFAIIHLGVSIGIIAQNRQYNDLFRPEIGLSSFNIVISFLGLVVSILGLICLFTNQKLISNIVAGLSVVLGIFALASLITAIVINSKSFSYVNTRFFTYMSRYSNDSDAKNMTDRIQTNYECCGETTWLDWARVQSAITTTVTTTSPTTTTTLPTTSTSQQTTTVTDEKPTDETIFSTDETTFSTDGSTTETTDGEIGTDETTFSTDGSAEPTVEITDGEISTDGTMTTGETTAVATETTIVATETTTVATETTAVASETTAVATETTTAVTETTITAAETISSTETIAITEEISTSPGEITGDSTVVTDFPEITGDSTDVTDFPEEVKSPFDEDTTIPEAKSLPSSSGKHSNIRREIETGNVLPDLPNSSDRQRRQAIPASSNIFNLPYGNQIFVPASCCVNRAVSSNNSSQSTCSSSTQLYTNGCLRFIVGRANQQDAGIIIINCFMIVLAFVAVPFLLRASMNNQSNEKKIYGSQFDNMIQFDSNPNNNFPSIVNTFH